MTERTKAWLKRPLSLQPCRMGYSRALGTTCFVHMHGITTKRCSSREQDADAEGSLITKSEQDVSAIQRNVSMVNYMQRVMTSLRHLFVLGSNYSQSQADITVK